MNLLEAVRVSWKLMEACNPTEVIRNSKEAFVKLIKNAATDRQLNPCIELYYAQLNIDFLRLVSVAFCSITYQVFSFSLPANSLNPAQCLRLRTTFVHYVRLKLSLLHIESVSAPKCFQHPFLLFQRAFSILSPGELRLVTG